MDSIRSMNLKVISPRNCNIVTWCLWESSPVTTVPPPEGCTDLVKAGLVHPSPRSLVLVPSYLFCVVCCDDATEEDKKFPSQKEIVKELILMNAFQFLLGKLYHS